MVAEDIAAFDGMMAAYNCPRPATTKNRGAPKRSRPTCARATETPLECARACAEVIAVARRAANSGYLGVISDAGVGVLAASPRCAVRR